MSMDLKEALVTGIQQILREKSEVEPDDLVKLEENLPVST